MSMTTTCPKCHTNFRVTGEQLAARDGKLRCGRCAHVFNGFMYLGTPLEPEMERSLPRRPAFTPPMPVADAVTATPDVEKTLVEKPVVEKSAAEKPALENKLDDDVLPIRILPDTGDSAPFDYQGLALPSEFLAKPFSDSPPISLHRSSTLGEHDIDLPDPPAYTPEPWPFSQNDAAKIMSHSPLAEPLRSYTTTINTKPVALKPAKVNDDFDDDAPDPLKEYFKDQADDDEDDDAFDGPTLLDDAANKRAKPHWAWSVGGLLLLLAAALQSIYLFRVDIAQALPDARPLMTQACGLLGCEVGLPQNLDALSIESSDLVADPTKPDQIELRATLRNKAGFSQTYPSLDFNLTDAQDEALVKRIIAPTTYLKPPATPSTGFAPNSEITIKLNFNAKDIKPAGYRLLLFYP